MTEQQIRQIAQEEIALALQSRDTIERWLSSATWDRARMVVYRCSKASYQPGSWEQVKPTTTPADGLEIVFDCNYHYRTGTP